MEPVPRAAVPLAPLLAGLLGGLFAAAGVPQPAALVPLLAPLFLAGVIAPRARRVFWGAGVGLLLGATHARECDRPADLPLPAVYEVEGVVVRSDPPLHDVQRFRLAAVRLRDDPGDPRSVPAVEAALRLRGPVEGLPDTLEPGLRLRCVMRLRKPRDAYERRRAVLHGYVADRRAVRLLHIGDGNGDGNGAANGTDWTGTLARGRARSGAVLDAHLEPSDAGLARALLLGDRTQLDPADRALFRRTGQAHLLAVSGLHVGLVLAGLLLLARHLGASRRATLLLSVVAAAVYVPFTGAPPSAVRAGGGVVLWMAARLVGRLPAGAAVLTLVGLLLLMHEPGRLFEPAFQLSFAAVLSILLLAGRIRDTLVRPRPVLPGLLPPVRAPVRTAFAVGLSAWLGTAPLVAFHMGRLCPAGPVLALPALPLTAVLLATGYLTLFLAPASPAAAISAWAFSACADVLRAWLELACSLGLDARPALRPSWMWGAAYGAAFLVATRGRTRAGLALLGALLCFLLLSGPGDGDMEGGWRDVRGYDPSQSTMQFASLQVPDVSGQVLLLVVIGLTAFAAVSVRPLGWLTAGGASAAWMLGVAATYAFGLPGLAALFAPFLVATLLGKLPGAERAGARTWQQVACNGATAFIGCVLVLVGCDVLGFAVFLGGLSCLGADTCATEIGVRFGGQPFRLLGHGPIASGESGGVTIAGFLGAGAGALLAPLAYLLCSSVPPQSMPLQSLGLLATAGFLGALIDSLLGGTLQRRGRDPQSGDVTEERVVDGRVTEPVSGLSWLDNDTVNLVSGLAAGFIAAGLIGLVA